MERPAEESFDDLRALNRVPFNTALDALDRPQRRRVLFALLHRGAETSVRLAEAEREPDRYVQSAPDDLARLAEHGFVDWDRGAHEVKRGERFDDIEPLLELLASRADELPDDWL